MDTSKDLLAGVLGDTGLSRRLLDLSELGAGRALRFPCNRSIGLHVVLQGPVHLHAPQFPEPLVLDSGDVVLMARGCDHVLALTDDLRGQAIDTIPVDGGATFARAPLAAAVVGGAYQFWHAPVHPFFSEMPVWSVLRAGELPRLGPLALSAGMLAEELRGTAPGSEVVTHALLDVVFTLALREVMARCAQERPGWSQAARDPQVGRAVALMHGDPAHAWTLDELAREAGMSRTALAERFREAMGDTPLNHLRALRMQRATRLLAQTSHNLEAVAAAVGYQDAFSFSKVFKRTVGVSPKAFRQQDAAGRQDPYRFQAGLQ